MAFLLLTGCAGKHHKDDALAAQHTAERIKETWAKVEKPLEIAISGRSAEELNAIGSIGVWFEGIEGGKAMEFRYDGKTFKPNTSTPVKVDSTVIPYVCYPYQPDVSFYDTIQVNPPIRQLLVGKLLSRQEQSDKIIINMEMNDLTALLRIRLQSDIITDILQGITIMGQFPKWRLLAFSGQWISDRYSLAEFENCEDCLLNNGLCHDFNLVPSENAKDIVVRIIVDGKPYRVSTTLPPMRMGSTTELRLNLYKGKLTVGSSWVDSKRKFEATDDLQPDTIKVGHYLQEDGSISDTYDSQSIAVVYSTNGKHGIAVGLTDRNAAYVFGKREYLTGHLFQTIDGIHREGLFPKAAQAKDADDIIVFDKRETYPKASAFGYRQGWILTKEILKHSSSKVREAFNETAALHTAYIPSLGEMAGLMQNQDILKDKSAVAFNPLRGCYLTSSESGKDTFYALDVTGGFISAYNSKDYPRANLRLFYLF